VGHVSNQAQALPAADVTSNMRLGSVHPKKIVEGSGPKLACSNKFLANDNKVNGRHSGCGPLEDVQIERPKRRAYFSA
jgi:hypothetical protein